MLPPTDLCTRHTGGAGGGKLGSTAAGGGSSVGALMGGETGGLRDIMGGETGGLADVRGGTTGGMSDITGDELAPRQLRQHVARVPRGQGCCLCRHAVPPPSRLMLMPGPAASPGLQLALQAGRPAGSLTFVAVTQAPSPT